MKKRCLTLAFLGMCFLLPAQEWSLSYAGGYPSGFTHFFDGLIDEDGVTFLAGEEGPEESRPAALLMRIEPDGTHQEVLYQRDGYYTKAICIVETSNHHLFVAGNLYNGTNDYLLTLVFDKHLNLLAERQYENEIGSGSFGESKATIDSHGHVILSTTVSRPNTFGGTDYPGVFYKFDSIGNAVGHRYLIADYPDPLYSFNNFKMRQMWLREDNETILCLVPGEGGVMSFVVFDTAFNLMEAHPIWRDPLDESDRTLFIDCYTDHWYNEEEALIFSSRGDYSHNKLRVSRVNTQGEFLEFMGLNERTDTIDDAARSRCMAAVNDSTFYFSFHYHTTPLLPGTACVYQLNDRLEIIGRHLDDDHENYWTSLILPTADGGCITVNDSCCNQPFGLIRHPVIKRLSTKDFETVLPCSLEVQHDAENVSACFPNPTSNTLYIPLYGLETSRVRCQITDVHGRIVTDQMMDACDGTLHLDVSRLKPGLYCYRIFSDQSPLTKEMFVKE